MGGSILLARRETNGKIGSTRSNLGNGLMDRGQTEARRHRVVVKADDGDVLRHPKTLTTQGVISGIASSSSRTKTAVGG